MPGIGSRKRNRIGSMRHIVRLQERSQTGVDDRGHPEYTWTDVIDDLPVSIRTLQGSEAETARQLFASATLRVEMRADSRITPQMRFLFGDRELYIGVIDNVDEVGRFMSVLCAEGID